MDALLVVLTAVAIVLSTFPVIVADISHHAAYSVRVLVLPADPLLVLVVVLAGIRAVTRPTDVTAPLALTAGAVAWLGVSLAIHPGALGAQIVGRQTAVVALALAISAVAGPRARIVLAGAAAAAAIAQDAVAFAQLARGGPLGLPQLGEFADALLRVGRSLAPRGTMYHPYALAGLACVGAGACLLVAFTARRPLPWLLATAIAIAPVGVTYSRTALLGLVIASACLIPAAVRGSRTHRAAIAALLVGAGIPAALAPGGWIARAEVTVTRVPDRGTLIVQAARVAADVPLFGVGPGRYDVALEDLRARDPAAVTVSQEPHSVPVLYAAEGGLPAGIAFLAGVVILLRDALRRGSGALAAFFLFAPFVFLEQYPYTHVQGAVILGTWIGLHCAWTRARTHDATIEMAQGVRIRSATIR